MVTNVYVKFNYARMHIREFFENLITVRTRTTFAALGDFSGSNKQ